MAHLEDFERKFIPNNHLDEGIGAIPTGTPRLLDPEAEAARVEILTDHLMSHPLHRRSISEPMVKVGAERSNDQEISPEAMFVGGLYSDGLSKTAPGFATAAASFGFEADIFNPKTREWESYRFGVMEDGQVGVVRTKPNPFAGFLD